MRAKIKTAYFRNFNIRKKVFVAEETLQRNNKLTGMIATRLKVINVYYTNSFPLDYRVVMY